LQKKQDSIEQNNEEKESPTEKAERLIREKESRDLEKDQKRVEEKQELINNKSGLEKEISDIDSQIDLLKNEAHEKRSLMKEAGLKDDDDFKGEFDSIIFDLANKLNILRIKKNELLQNLKEASSSLVNFDKSLDELKKEEQEKSSEKIDNLRNGIIENDVFEKDKETVSKLINDIFKNVENKLNELETKVNSFDSKQYKDEEGNVYYDIYNQLDFVKWELSPLNKKVEGRSASVIYKALDNFSNKAHENGKWSEYTNMENDIISRYNEIHQKSLKLQAELKKRAGI
jgi:hypothetical protein